MLSRVANSIYWMNRYMERAENYARFINVNFNLALDLPPGSAQQWEPLLVVTDDLENFKAKYKEVNRENVIHFLAFDPANPNSIISSLQQARENARTVRENISLEMWEQINQLYLMVNDSGKLTEEFADEPREFFRRIILGCQLFYGITESTVSHTQGWHFGRMGRFLERADKTSRILDVKYHILLPSVKKVGSPLDLLQWIALLKSNSAYSMCRKKYGVITAENVVEFLILDRHFPRSIFFCIDQVKKSLEKVSSKTGGNTYNEAEKILGSLRTDLEYKEVKQIIQQGIHEYMNNLQIKFNNISDAIFESFFKIEETA